MKLSIIVPVYNMAAEGKLSFCLDSLLHQTIADQGIAYEIIAVDDASTDDSLSVLKQYAAEYPERIRVLTHEKNKRQGGAKNTGLQAATGEWIGFIDSDDWIAPEFYEKLIKKAEETDADMVGCDYSLVSEHTYQVGKVVSNNSAEQTGVLDVKKHGMLIMRSGSMVIKIYKGDIIRENHLDFPEGIFYEDNCAGPLWSLYFHRFERVEEPLYYYYQHQTSTVHVVTEEKCRDRMQAGQKLYDESKERGFLEAYFPELEYRFTELYFVNTLFSYMLGAKPKRLGFVKELYKGQVSCFPEFESNSYYKQYTGAEEKEWIALLGKSPAAFFYYYRFKFAVRKLIVRMRGKRAGRA